MSLLRISYDPKVFLTGKSYKLEIFDAREPDRVHKSIALTKNSKLIQQIRKDFGEMPEDQ